MRDRLSCEEMSRVLAANLVRLIGTTPQQEIADKVGISRSALNKIMNGRVDPRLSTVQALADVLGVSLVDLTEAEGTRTEPTRDAQQIAELYDDLDLDDKAFVRRFVRKLAGEPPLPE